MNTLISSFLILGSLLASSAAKANGGISSGGGNAEAQHFVATGHAVLDYLTNAAAKGTDLGNLVNRDQFRTSLREVEVIGQERVYLDGIERDAMYDRSLKRIYLNITRWRALAQDRNQRMGLVFHEYLGVMGVPDTRYEHSQALRASLEREPPTYFEDFDLICSPDAALIGLGIKELRIFDISEHMAWVEIWSPEGKASVEKYLRWKGNGGDEFATGGPKGSLAFEVDYRGTPYKTLYEGVREKAGSYEDLFGSIECLRAPRL